MTSVSEAESRLASATPAMPQRALSRGKRGMSGARSLPLELIAELDAGWVSARA